MLSRPASRMAGEPVADEVVGEVLSRPWDAVGCWETLRFCASSGRSAGLFAVWMSS